MEAYSDEITDGKKWIDASIQHAFVRAEMRSKRDGAVYEHQVIRELLHDLVWHAKHFAYNDDEGGYPEPTAYDHAILNYYQTAVELHIRGLIAQVAA